MVSERRGEVLLLPTPLMAPTFLLALGVPGLLPMGMGMGRVARGLPPPLLLTLEKLLLLPKRPGSAMCPVVRDLDMGCRWLPCAAWALAEPPLLGARWECSK